MPESDSNRAQEALRSFSFLLSKLNGESQKIPKKKSNEILAKGTCLCPVHEADSKGEHTPSLGLAVKVHAETGEIGLLWHCYAGCGRDEVSSAVRVILDSMPCDWKHDASGSGAIEGQQSAKLKTLKKSKLQKLLDSNEAYKKIAASWVYHDASGAAVLKKTKYHIICRKTEQVLTKTYIVFHWDLSAGTGDPGASGGWVPGQGDVKPLLYGGVALRKAQASGLPVVVCEGEKDADNVLKHFKIAAVSPQFGTGSWAAEYSAELAAGDVVLVLCDNDSPGIAGSLRRAISLVLSGLRVKLITPFGEQPGTGYDVSDWIASGKGTKESFISLVKSTPWFILDGADPEVVESVRLEIEASAKEASKRHSEALEITGIKPIDVASLVSAAGERYTDEDYVDRLAIDYGHLLRYVPEKGAWLRFENGLWSGDSDVEAFDILRDLTDRMLTAARGYRVVNDGDAERRRELLKNALYPKNTVGARAVISFARNSKKLNTSVNDFDTERMSLNCINGELDLATGRIAPHRSTSFASKQIALRYDPTAVCPLWDDFIAQTFIVKTNNPYKKDENSELSDEQKTRELVRFIQRLCGYVLTGTVSEQKFFFLQGEGSNGKSVFLNTLLGVLGNTNTGYSATIPVGAILKSSFSKGGGSGENATPVLAQLPGKRLVAAGELPSGAHLNDSIIKDMVGGDPINVRALRQQPFCLHPQFKLFVRCNSLPHIAASDYGIWRKLVVIPFLNHVSPEETDRELEQKLRAEHPGILRWCVEGAIEWSRVGLMLSTACDDFSSEYKAEMDWLNQFVVEACVVEPQAIVTRSDLYNAYKEWAAERGEYVLSQTKFVQDMKRAGYFSPSTNMRISGEKTARVFRGIKVNNTWLSEGANRITGVLQSLDENDDSEEDV